MLTLPPMAATGIGSVPFTEAGETVALIVETLPQVPYWPQMVRLGFGEEMTAQSAGGLAALRLDAVARTVEVDAKRPRDEALAEFYEVALSGDLAPFAMKEKEAHGFYALLRAVEHGNVPCRALKGQLAGPVTFAGMVKDQEGKAMLFDRELTQAACLGLARKAAWQAQKFRELGKDPVIFLDEPFLTGFGSAYLPISREEVLEILGQTIEELRQAAGKVAVGLHCCGNTDWGLLLEAPIDILSFDSYGYFESLRLYDQAVAKFFLRGGWLAWGLVPTGAEEFRQETADSLWERFALQVAQLAQDQKAGLREILSRALLTPACGMGYLSPEEARRGFQVLSDLSVRGRQWLAAL